MVDRQKSRARNFAYEGEVYQIRPLAIKVWGAKSQNTLWGW